ncbi:SCO family protein [Photobacterium sp. DNB23_23_1]|uniref:SCO family protein n=1 Tax=Photobacterium pectinilyticum TaxID=2906793 RepID=A0ABT1N8Z1_9GAMM|nr:SCO family protein [Photobacterium sp. ZSDE20]MCQ1061207.1 SCO family protein [Photobacterium sp. ZSDE20]MDD1829584.1 SCO family protein [Photobacterium sp. ZSDE20]
MKKNQSLPLLAMLLTSLATVSFSAMAAKWRENYFPNTELITHNNTKVKFYDDLLKDKVVLINFIFTRCQNVCPMETARLVALQKKLGDRVGKDVFFYSISIDPEHDTPERLNDYAQQYQIGPGWFFLTGNQEEINELRTKLGLTIDDLEVSDDGELDHNLSLIIGNEATGRWMKRSPYEDTAVLAAMVGDWLHNWQTSSTTQHTSYDKAPKLNEESQGLYLYRTRCVTCHSYSLEENKLGPNLSGVTTRREESWLRRWLKEPDKMLEEKDPTAIALFEEYNQVPMPNLQLTQHDIDELILFMKEQDSQLTAQNATKTTP